MKKVVDVLLNIVIFVLVILATIAMLMGFQPMGEEEKLTETSIEVFKFFTVDSNLLIGIMAIIFAKYEINLLKGKIKEIPKCIYGLKLAATVGVVLTFLVTAFFLAPTYSRGYFALFINSFVV